MGTSRPTTSWYFDHNATTTVDPAVADLVARLWSGPPANAGSRHALGRSARKILDDSAEQVAAALGAHPDEVVFTSGATESNNLAVHGLAESFAPSRCAVLATEHPSVLEPVRRLERRGWAVDVLGVDSQGRCLAIDHLPAETRGVFVQLANSETGVVQDSDRIRALASAGSLWHADAVQAVGRIPVSFHELTATSLAVSSHKIHGPPGVGALLVRRGAPLAPLLTGGGQQRERRAGTEPVALIAGFALAVERAVASLEENARRLAQTRDAFEANLLARVERVCVNGCPSHRLPNTSNLSFLGTRTEALLIALDLAGVYASAGTACASGSLEPSPVLEAMHLDRDRIDSAVRFSFARTTDSGDVVRAADEIARNVERVRRAIS